MSPITGLPHYEPVPIPVEMAEVRDDLEGHTHALFFYGGWASSFASDAAIRHRHPFAQGWTTFRTPEHLFHALKATTLEDFEHVRRAPDARQAKARGGRGGITCRPDWDEESSETGNLVCYDAMHLAHLLKYKQQGTMIHNLRQTTGLYIAEDSPTDDKWGIRDRGRGFTGQNLLGKVLMQIREELS